MSNTETPLPSWEMTAAYLTSYDDIKLMRLLFPSRIMRGGDGYAFLSDMNLWKVYRTLTYTAKLMRGRKLTWDDGHPFSYKEHMQAIGVSRSSFYYAIAELEDYGIRTVAEDVYTAIEQARRVFKRDIEEEFI